MTFVSFASIRTLPIILGTAIPVDMFFLGMGWNNQNRLSLFTKASLLAGVGFALAMNWGQTGYSLNDYHVELVLGPRSSEWLIMSNHYPTPFRGLKPRCVHPTWFHLRPGVRMHTHTDIQDDIHCECCECNVVQCNVMWTNTAVEYMLCIQKHWATPSRCKKMNAII